MGEMKDHDCLATVIGDVVHSRAAPDRSRLHDRLVDLLSRANRALRPTAPLRITVGDEFQGCFHTVGAAVHATLWLQLQLAPDAELRHGIGWGSLTVLSRDPRVEDGPGWWAARQAIETVKAEAGRAASRQLRTAYRRAEGDAGAGGPEPDAVNAALICRDQMVGSVTERSLRLLRGTLAGLSQAQLAQEEGISASAVSQRVRHHGLAAIVAADELLRRV